MNNLNVELHPPQDRQDRHRFKVTTSHRDPTVLYIADSRALDTTPAILDSAVPGPLLAQTQYIL